MPIDIAELIERQRIGWFQIRTLVLCIAIVTLDGYDAQIIGYVISTLARLWQVDRSSFGPVLSAGFLGLLVGAFACGLLADRFGRKRIIVACTLVFGGFSLLTVIAWSFESLLVLRFLTGLGIGGAVPNSIALIAEYAPKRRRATMTTLLGAGVSIGAASAGLLTASLLARFGWSAVFYVGGVLPLALVPLLVWHLPESLRLLVLQQRPADDIAALLGKIAPELRGMAPLAVTLPEERRSGLPATHLFTEGRAPFTVLMWAAFLLNLLAVYSLVGWLPTLINGIGLTVERAAIVAAMFSLGGICGAVVLGRLIDVFGAYGVLAIVFVMGGLMIALIGSIGPVPMMLGVVVLGAGFCTAGGQHGANAHAGDFYPTFMRSTGVGWAMGIGRIGAVIGPLLLGALLARQWPLPMILAVYALTTCCAAGAIFLMGRLDRAARPARAEPPPLAERLPVVPRRRD
jgi:AAHS family 4-hydroxybenzoate transporter-like MFS transporter